MVQHITPKPLRNLAQLISRQLIPQVEQAGSQVLRMPCNTIDLPPGVQVEKKTIREAGVKVKNRRSASELSFLTTVWPEAGLCAKDEPFFYWVISGNVQMQVGNQWLSCSEGTIIFIPPDLPHPTGADPNSLRGNGSLFLFRQTGRGLRCWISHLHDSLHLRPRPGESFYFPEAQTLESFSVLCQGLLDYSDERIVRYAMLTFLLLLQRDLKANQAFDIAAFASKREAEVQNYEIDYDPMDKACTYIQSHLADNLTLENVARVVHMSRASFARQFSQRMDKTFLTYVQELRLERAKTFLLETGFTVNVIGPLCGFSSSSSFTKFFARCTGQSPNRFRLTHQTASPRIHRDEMTSL